MAIMSLVNAYFYAGSESFSCGDYGIDERSCSFERREEMGVVDVFFSQLKAGDDPWLYYGSAIEAMVNSVELMLAESIDSGRRSVYVHIVSDIPEVLHLNFSNYVIDYVTLYDATKPQFMNVRTGFFDVYKDRHHSQNEMGYEFTCFLRWLFYKMIAEQPQKGPSGSSRQMRRVISMDADVVFMHPVDMVYSRAIATLTRGNCSHAFEDFDVVVMGFGSVHFFSSDGLSTYAKYITALYEQDVAIVQKRIWRDGRFRHYSDMQSMEEFVNEDRTRRSSCLTAMDKAPSVTSRSCQKSGDRIEGVTCHDYEALGCMVANTMTNFKKVATPKLLMHKLIAALGATHRAVGTTSVLQDEKELHDLLEVTGTLTLQGDSKKFLPGNLSLCYLHFQGSHKRTAVQWTLVLRHLYWRYRSLQHPKLYQNDELLQKRLFFCKEGFSDVMYLDGNLGLREVGRLGVAPFVDIKGLTIRNENTKENPLVLLGYMIIRLKNGQLGNLVVVDDALYWSFKGNGTAFSIEERQALGL